MSRQIVFSFMVLVALGCLGSVAEARADPKVDPNPINLKKNAVLYQLDFYKAPPISPAMQAVCMLTVLYYCISFAKQMSELQQYRYEQESQPLNGIGGNDDHEHSKNKLMSKIKYTIEMLDGVMQEIPMLAILIVFARLRARVDLEGSNPQSWVQLVFIVAVSIVYFQALVITCCSPGKEGNASEKKEANNLKKAVKGFKVFLSFCLMACVVLIFISIFTLRKEPIYD